MALTACPECKGQVSDSAAACPHCGAPNRDGTPIRARIDDLDIRFGTLIVLLVKVAIAMIPAFILVLIIGAMAWGFLAAVFGPFSGIKP